MSDASDCYNTQSYTNQRMFTFTLTSLFGIEGPVKPYINSNRSPCFRASARSIRYCYQLTITSPRINLIDYGSSLRQAPLFCIESPAEPFINYTCRPYFRVSTWGIVIISVNILHEVLHPLIYLYYLYVRYICFSTLLSFIEIFNNFV